MKTQLNFLFSILIALLLVSCTKEESLVPQIQFMEFTIAGTNSILSTSSDTVEVSVSYFINGLEKTENYKQVIEPGETMKSIGYKLIDLRDSESMIVKVFIHSTLHSCLSISITEYGSPSLETVNFQNNEEFKISKFPDYLNPLKIYRIK